MTEPETQNPDEECPPAEPAAVAGLLDTIESLKGERDEAREWVRRITAETRTLTCVYCGHAYPPGTPDHGAETLAAHIRVCAKHPMRALEIGPPLVDAEALLEKLCHLINDKHVYKQEALALLNDALGARAMTEVQALTACKHGKPTCGECLEEAPLELLRLNPFARHDIENKPPTDPAGAFIFGIRYYAGMLEDGDDWWHSLGHIESLCRDFQNAIDDRAGKPRRFPVTDDALDAPDGAIVNGYQRSGDQWIKLPDEVVTLRARVAELEAMTPAEFERRAIARAIETHRTCRKAAKALGIGKATLYRRIQRGEFTLPPRVLKGSEP